MRIPFGRVAHLVTLPVSVAGNEERFILDTGIGPTLVSSALCERAGCVPTGTVFAGRRMSGQEVELELATARSVRLGGFERPRARGRRPRSERTPGRARGDRRLPL